MSLLEELILEDHRDMKAMLEKYRTALTKDEAHKWYNQFVWEVCRHAIGEELVLYPLLKERIPNGPALVEESLEEHRETKKYLSEIEHLDYRSDEFDVKVRTMVDGLLKHMEKEEAEVIKLLVQFLSKEERLSAGARFNNRKRIAPTHPHTMIPDNSPIFETLSGLIVAPIDKFFDLFKEFPEAESVDKLEKNSNYDTKQVRMDFKCDKMHLDKDKSFCDKDKLSCEKENPKCWKVHLEKGVSYCDMQKAQCDKEMAKLAKINREKYCDKNKAQCDSEKIKCDKLHLEKDIAHHDKERLHHDKEKRQDSDKINL